MTRLDLHEGKYYFSARSYVFELPVEAAKFLIQAETLSKEGAKWQVCIRCFFEREGLELSSENPSQRTP